LSKGGEGKEKMSKGKGKGKKMKPQSKVAQRKAATYDPLHEKPESQRVRCVEWNENLLLLFDPEEVSDNEVSCCGLVGCFRLTHFETGL
jgi:hypothetical protein